MTKPERLTPRVLALTAQAEEADLRTGGSSVRSGMILGRLGQVRSIKFSVVESRALFEGDIDLGEADALAPGGSAPVSAGTEGIMSAVVVSDLSRMWPKGRIPFELIPAGSPISQLVTRATATFEELTPVRFVPRSSNDTDFIAFEVSSYCSSRVGRGSGRQVVRISVDASLGNVIHELCHAAGLWHEQSREDRDQFVDIRWQNVTEGYEHNFRQQIADGDDVGPYDFDSIMHYPAIAFSRNGEATIIAKVGGVQFGQRDHLSQGDIDALTALYSDDVAPVGPQTPLISGPDGEANVQFTVDVAPGQSAKVKTSGWPVDRAVIWHIAPESVNADPGPVLSHEIAVGRFQDAVGNSYLNYYITVSNASRAKVRAVARYKILET